MEQAIYTDGYGQQRVATVPKYIGAICKDNICGVVGAYFKGEFVGNATHGYYIIPRGWYLGAASDGSAMVYQNGTGPRHGQAAGVAPQRTPQAIKKQLSPAELKAAIQADHNYDFDLVYAARLSTSTKTAYVGVLTYRGQSYQIPAEEVLDYVPIYNHTGERYDWGDPIFKDGSHCNPTSGFCKDAGGNALGLVDYKVEDYRRQGILPAAPAASVGVEVSSVANQTADNALTGETCYDQKMAAFRKENGEEAMIIHDQIVEWEQQCGLPTE
ncbi:hypothetical protein IPC85_07980 [Pseudomonas aeruginosa]|nr:hypothetical protein IPC85_07980 [Pseudomonas aeruginosa]RMK89332.1 hypothetical protein IPC84_02990 [Pseudomonas aeruginosa]